MSKPHFQNWELRVNFKINLKISQNYSLEKSWKKVSTCKLGIGCDEPYQSYTSPSPPGTYKSTSVSHSFWKIPSIHYRPKSHNAFHYWYLHKPRKTNCFARHSSRQWKLAEMAVNRPRRGRYARPLRPHGQPNKNLQVECVIFLVMTGFELREFLMCCVSFVRPLGGSRESQIGFSRAIGDGSSTWGGD